MKLSVIIVAYTRKEFIKSAIDSVLNQTLDKSKYEIIVVKQFKDKETDAYINKNKVQSLYLDPEKDKRLETKMIMGASRAHGDVLCFLEDDDMFVDTKLAHVYDEFMSIPTLVYYHNNNFVIDKDGCQINNFSMFHSEDRVMAANNLTGIYNIIFCGLSFNNSCCSIKKNVFMANVPFFKRTQRSHDDFMAYAAIASGGDMLCDDVELTKYRVHGANDSITTDLRTLDNDYGRYISASAIFEEMLSYHHSKKGLRVLRGMSLRHKMNNLVLQNKKITLSQMLEYLKFYTLPYLIYCHRIDKFLLLALYSRVNNANARLILLKHQNPPWVHVELTK